MEIFKVSSENRAKFNANAKKGQYDLDVIDTPFHVTLPHRGNNVNPNIADKSLDKSVINVASRISLKETDCRFFKGKASDDDAEKIMLASKMVDLTRNNPTLLEQVIGNDKLNVTLGPSKYTTSGGEYNSKTHSIYKGNFNGGVNLVNSVLDGGAMFVNNLGKNYIKKPSGEPNYMNDFVKMIDSSDLNGNYTEPDGILPNMSSEDLSIFETERQKMKEIYNSSKKNYEGDEHVAHGKNFGDMKYTDNTEWSSDTTGCLKNCYYENDVDFLSGIVEVYNNNPTVLKNDREGMYNSLNHYFKKYPDNESGNQKARKIIY